MLKPYSIGDRLFDFKTPYVMGVMNITPDSFSDGGLYFNPDDAFYRIETLIKEGADIIDIGAESTRPFAIPISASEEIERLKPILTGYKKRFSCPLSLDTTKYEVAKLGLDHGVDIINDISGLTRDPRIGNLVKEYNKTLLIMHSQGDPSTMQMDPVYEDVISEIKDFFIRTLRKTDELGISQVILDPGIGFGKTIQHNLKILRSLSCFLDLEHPLLIGTSRKSFLGHITNSSISDRLPETIASNVLAFAEGVHIFRVHDVGPVKKALKVAETIIPRL